MIKNALDQYTDICTEAIYVSGAKLTKSFQKVLLDVILLTVIITGKKNFTQLGRFGKFTEQTYRNLFGRKRSASINWLKLNVTLAKRFFGSKDKWAIAIDPSFIQKAGKKTPHTGRFCSGAPRQSSTGLSLWAYVLSIWIPTTT